MSELSYTTSDALREAVLGQPVWSEFDRHDPTQNEKAARPGYIMVCGGYLPQEELPLETRERLGFTTYPTDDLTTLYLGRKVIEAEEGRIALAAMGDQALFVRLERRGRLVDAKYEDEARKIDGRWIMADYILSIHEVSSDPSTPPLTDIEVSVYDSTELMRATFGAWNDVLASLQARIPIDPETGEPDPGVLVSSLTPEEYLRIIYKNDPDALAASLNEYAVDQGVAKIAGMNPITNEEVLALVGIVKRCRAFREI